MFCIFYLLEFNSNILSTKNLKKKKRKEIKNLQHLTKKYNLVIAITSYLQLIKNPFIEIHLNFKIKSMKTHAWMVLVLVVKAALARTRLQVFNGLRLNRTGPDHDFDHTENLETWRPKSIQSWDWPELKKLRPDQDRIYV